MPGTLWPCWLLVGDSIAPDPTSSSRFRSPASMRFINQPQLTAATQPHPLPPLRQQHLHRQPPLPAVE